MNATDLRPGDTIIVNHLYFKVNLDMSLTCHIHSINDLAHDSGTTQKGYLPWGLPEKPMPPAHNTPAPKRPRIKYEKITPFKNKG